MRKILALTAALCLALGLAGCGQEQTMEDDAPAAYLDAGDAAAEQGDFDAAVEAYSLAIGADEDRAAAYMGRAGAYLALADGEQDDESGADLSPAALARQDHIRALELDPGLGAEIYGIYAERADEALEAGDGERALLDMQTAIAAAPEKAGEFEDRAKAVTDEMLPGSVWYMDAPDSRYFQLFADGSGRVLDAVKMEPAGRLTWENEGLTVTVTVQSESERWTYAPDRLSYYAAVTGPEGDERDMRIGRASLRGMYARWQGDILAQRAECLRDDTTAEEKAGVYEALCVRERALLDALGKTLGETVKVDDDGAELGAQETFSALRRMVNGLLMELPEGEKTAATALGELFPIGDGALLDYMRLAADWSLRAGELTVPESGPAVAAWESLEDVEHYFEDGRLYLLLEGYTRERDDALTPEDHGLYPLETPLTCWDDCTLEGSALLAKLRDSRWLGLWEQGDGTFFLDLTLDKNGDCSAAGGHYPGKAVGTESGDYGLEGRELTLDLTAEGYLPGSYRYQVFAMGESLYCTLLTDGIVFGQTAGSRYLFCGGEFAQDARTRIG